MVVAMGDDVTPELVDRIGASLREELPDVRVVLIAGARQFAVYRPT